MSNILNENNVFVTFERFVVVESRDLKIEILIAEEDGVWFSAYQYQKGNSGDGDYYAGHYPSKSKRDKRFSDRQQAINHQLEQLETAPKEVAEVVKNFRQPNLFQ